MPDSCPAHRPVAARVNRASIIGLETDMVDLVALDHMVVSEQRNRHVGRIMDEVVRGAVADACDFDCGLRCSLPATVVVDVAPPYVVPAWRQRDAIPALERDAALACPGDLAVADSVRRTATDLKSPAAGIPDRAILEHNVRPTGHTDRGTAC